MVVEALERSQAVAVDYVRRAEALAPRIAALSDRIEQERRLPPELLDDLHAAGLFRLLLPKSQNGGETDPVTLFRVMETVSAADASTAWCLGQAAGCALTAAYLDPAVARRIFGSDPRAVLAWGPGPKVKAVAVEGGYRVTGTWSFNSGGRHATWLGAHAPVCEPDGSLRRKPDGRPVERTMLVPAADIVWTDIWSVIGLRGTGSDAFTLADHFVPQAHSVERDSPAERREAGPLYRMTTHALYPVAFAGVALGIARAAMDAFVAMARDKVPRGMKSPLRDNAAVQSQAAQAEIALRAARSHLLQVVGETWAEVQRSFEFTLERRMAIRGATTYAIHRAREAVDFAYYSAGATAIFESSPLERRFRDMHTVTQQLQGRQAHFEAVGAHLLGAEPDLTFV